MNISPFTIYLWQLADKISDALFILALISAFISGGCWLARFLEDAETKKVAVATTLIFFASLLGNTFLPSSKTIAMMVVIPEIAHSKVVQQDLPDIYNAAVKALKDQLAK